jgi:hypothetical protein
MKTARRHELRTNELADWLGKEMVRLRPHGRAIAATVLLIVLSIVLVVFYSNRGRQLEEQAWSQYFAALDELAARGNIDRLRDVSEQYPRTPAGLWAHLTLADAQLAEGTENMFRDRQAALTQLQSAIQNYDYVRQHAKDPLLLERATFGLARAYESQADLERAKKTYQELQSRWPQGPFAQAAQERLEDLARRPTHKFYDWFKRQNPQPPAPQDEDDLKLLPDRPPARNGSARKKAADSTEQEPSEDAHPRSPDTADGNEQQP